MICGFQSISIFTVSILWAVVTVVGITYMPGISSLLLSNLGMLVALVGSVLMLVGALQPERGLGVAGSMMVWISCAVLLAVEAALMIWYGVRGRKHRDQEEQTWVWVSMSITAAFYVAFLLLALSAQFCFQQPTAAATMIK